MSFDDSRRTIPSLFSDLPIKKMEAARKGRTFWRLATVLVLGLAAGLGAAAYWQYTQALSAQNDAAVLRVDLEQATRVAATFGISSDTKDKIAQERYWIIRQIDPAINNNSYRQRSAIKAAFCPGQWRAGACVMVIAPPAQPRGAFTDPGGADMDARTQSQRIGAAGQAANDVLQSELNMLKQIHADVQDAMARGPQAGPVCHDPRGCPPH